MKIRANWSDRWGILGSTGSGKTYASKEILKHYAKISQGNFPIYIIDSKIDDSLKEFEKPGIGVVHEGNTLPPIHKPKEHGGYFQIFRPEFDDFDMYDEYLFNIYQESKLRRTPAIIYIDELESLKKGGSSASVPKFYSQINKMGRSLGLGLINCFQSSTWLPTDFLRQSTHILRFRLGHEDDQKKMKKLAVKLFDEPLNDFGFLYKNNTMPIAKAPVLEFPSISSFINGDGEK